MSESDKQEPGFTSDGERAEKAVSETSPPTPSVQPQAPAPGPAEADLDGPPGLTELPRDMTGDAAMQASSRH